MPYLLPVEEPGTVIAPPPLLSPDQRHALAALIDDIDPASLDPAELIERLMMATIAAQASLAQAERRFSATLSQAPVGIAHVATDGRFLLVNDRFAEICGHDRQSLLEHGFQRITHPDDLESDMHHVGKLLSGEADRYVMEKRYLRPDGSVVWVNLTVAMVRTDRGDPDFFVSVIEDMSDIRQAHAAATLDPVTNLLNRRGFVTQSEQAIARAARSGDMISIAYIDLDGFKRINDAYGHRAGDTCLAEVARTIQNSARSGDIVGRLGGDEFAMLMPHLSADHAGGAMERVRAGLVGLGRRQRWPISGSFGVISLVPDDGTDVETLIAQADEAMFRAKRAGKNCVERIAA